MTAPSARADYRPVLTAAGVAGARCGSCGYPTAPATPRCPVCGAATATTDFPPTGTVWAATVVHIPVGERRPPFTMSYVDLDDGPRVLAVVAADRAPSVGARVRLEPADGEWAVAVEPAASAASADAVERTAVVEP